MSGFSESSTVQAAIVERLAALGWEYIPGRDLPRPLDSVFLQPHVVDALIRLNPLIAAQPDRVDEVLPKLRAVALSAVNDGLVAANERMTTWLRGHQTLKYIGTDDYVPVRLIDFGQPSMNQLVVSDEVTFGPPGHTRRFDIVLWVNGLPLVVGETKTPVDKTKSWLNGAIDIHDVYEVEALRLLHDERAVLCDRGPRVPLRRGGPTRRALAHVGCHDRPVGPRRRPAGDALGRVAALTRPGALDPAGLRPVRPAEDRQPCCPTEADPALPAGRRRRGDPREGDGSDSPPGTDLALPGHRQDPPDGFRRAAALERPGGWRSDGVDRARSHRPGRADRPPVPDCWPAPAAGGGHQRALRRMLAEDQRGIIVTTIFRFEGAGLLNDRDNIIVLVDEAHRTQEGRLGHDLRIAAP